MLLHGNLLRHACKFVGALIPRDWGCILFVIGVVLDAILSPVVVYSVHNEETPFISSCTLVCATNTQPISASTIHQVEPQQMTKCCVCSASMTWV